MIAHNKKTLLKPIRRETKTETGDVILEEDTYMLSGNNHHGLLYTPNQDVKKRAKQYPVCIRTYYLCSLI